MNIVSCQFCKKPFASLSGKICPDCLEQLDKDFIKVRDFIYDSKLRPSVDTISEETEVPKQHIIHLIKEGRLILDDPGEGLVVCEVCKKPIKTGRICDACKDKLAAAGGGGGGGGGAGGGGGGPKPQAPPKQDNFRSARVGRR